jgi:hypothetical protein
MTKNIRHTLPELCLVCTHSKRTANGKTAQMMRNSARVLEDLMWEKENESGIDWQLPAWGAVGAGECGLQQRLRCEVGITRHWKK